MIGICACVSIAMRRLLCHASPIDWSQTIASQFDDWKYILIIYACLKANKIEACYTYILLCMKWYLPLIHCF